MNIKMKNTELLALPEVKEAFKAGKVVVIDKKLTNNKEFTNLYFIGEVDGLGGASSEVTSIQAQLLGFNTKLVQRCISNAKTEIADKIEVGSTLDAKIRVIDSLKPSYQGHTPRANSSGELLKHNGKEIYRTTELCSADELEEKSHQTLKVTRATVEEKQGADKSSLIEQAAQ